MGSDDHRMLINLLIIWVLFMKYPRYLDDLPSLDIRSRTNRGKALLLKLQHSESGQLFVSLADYVGAVHFESTACHYGGLRYWLLCPSCGGKKAILRVYHEELLCNDCINKPFASASKSKRCRGVIERGVILDRLGLMVSLYEPLFTAHKPKGMHQKTYSKLMHRYNCLLLKEAAYFDKVFSLVNEVSPLAEAVENLRTVQ